ncbi:MAG: LuxR C-terminal-related transcriptional regulator, partial [Thermomicrobiales bacterium]
GAYWAHLVLGHAALTNGDLAQATDCYKTALAIAPRIRDPENHAAMALVNLGEIASGQGEYARAEPWLIEAAAFVRVCGNPWVATHIYHQLGQVYRHQGQYAKAASALAECLDCLAKAGDTGQTKVALMELAHLAVDIARPATAIHLLAAATQVPGVYWPPSEMEETASPLRTAVPEPRFSAEWAVGESMSWNELIALVSRLADDEGIGASSGSSEAILTPGLSPREMDVLRQLVDGQSNRAIGETLSISERTVEAHVQHILAKLEVDSRTAAATYAVRHGLD